MKEHGPKLSTTPGPFPRRVKLPVSCWEASREGDGKSE